ncbi:PhnE/PtxC family ABC transporter permease [Oceanimonas baumannii]|uniref:Phosphonate transport system permease protein n=2 Tax=Oceanimonas baumannii TaxID=129578 RepID=A0ABY2EVH4_9GAMM|nr:ABC transporter permease [Oceanimonas baumannii]TDW56316.1 phosphonate transport system permease protein [Oceanimonas baumannii]
MISSASMGRTSLLFVVVALLCLPWADFSTSTVEPWFELRRLGAGLLLPAWPDVSVLLSALFNTLAFALQGVALGALLGLGLACSYRSAWVRRLAAGLRAVHELFWALLFMQLLGLSALAGVLAIALPYAGTFAKIYGELFEEADPAPEQALPAGFGRLTRLIYLQLPLCWRQMATYTGYRLECGIRSSAVLGFIGLPTLGYHLESLLRQGYYDEAAAFFYALVLIIATLRWWLRGRLVPVYLLAALLWLPPVASFNWALMARFFTEDIIPAPLRTGDWAGLWPWWVALWQQQAGPGLANTLVLALVSLVVTGALALLWFPTISRRFGNGISRSASHGWLVLMRSLPEYLLAFVGMLLLGPGMLPAMLALSLHNGAIIAHLLGHHLNTLSLREDAPRGLNLYFFEVLPRLYRAFMAYSLYRFENLIRETAILGMLGIPTLGFFIDSAFSEFRFDRAMALLLVCAWLNIVVDVLARRLRQRLHLGNRAEVL